MRHRSLSSEHNPAKRSGQTNHPVLLRYNVPLLQYFVQQNVQNYTQPRFLIQCYKCICGKLKKKTVFTRNRRHMAGENENNAASQYKKDVPDAGIWKKIRLQGCENELMIEDLNPFQFQTCKKRWKSVKKAENTAWNRSFVSTVLIARKSLFQDQNGMDSEALRLSICLVPKFENDNATLLYSHYFNVSSILPPPVDPVCSKAYISAFLSQIQHLFGSEV